MTKPFKVDSSDALAMARSFREGSKLLGDYLYANWGKLSPEEQNTLRSLEVTLLNVATDLVTQAVDVILEGGKANLKAVSDATTIAQSALRNIELAKKAITIATALIGLAGAIPTGSIGAISSAIIAVVEAAQAPIAHPRKGTKGATQPKKVQTRQRKAGGRR